MSLPKIRCVPSKIKSNTISTSKFWFWKLKMVNFELKHHVKTRKNNILHPENCVFCRIWQKISGLNWKLMKWKLLNGLWNVFTGKRQQIFGKNSPKFEEQYWLEGILKIYDRFPNIWFERIKNFKIWLWWLINLNAFQENLCCESC